MKDSKTFLAVVIMVVAFIGSIGISFWKTNALQQDLAHRSDVTEQRDAQFEQVLQELQDTQRQLAVAQATVNCFAQRQSSWDVGVTDLLSANIPNPSNDEATAAALQQLAEVRSQLTQINNLCLDEGGANGPTSNG